MKKKHYDNLVAKLNGMTTNQKKERLNFLNSLNKNNLDQKKRDEYLILKFDVDGKDCFLSDPFTSIIMWDSIFYWINNKLNIPEKIKDLFYAMHWDWLIDWKASNNNLNQEIIVREEIYENLHSIILPMLAEIEAVLKMDYKTLKTSNIKERIKEINKFISDLSGSNSVEVFITLFKVKNAIYSAKLFLDNYKEYICQSRVKIDLEFITHILLRHVKRFKTLNHKNNTSPRSFFNFKQEDEFLQIFNILQENTKIYNGENQLQGTIKLNNDTFKYVIKGSRLVTLFPISEK